MLPVTRSDFLTRSVLNEVTTSPETLKAAMPGITVTKKFDLASNTRAVAVINTTLDPMYSLQQNIWYKRPFMMNFPKEVNPFFPGIMSEARLVPS